MRLLIAGIASTLLSRGNANSLLLAVPDFVQFGSVFLLLIGLWTPVAGALLAAVEVWILSLSSDLVSTRMILGALGAALSMIGPGAYSIDARLFGRKIIKAP